MGHDSFDQEQWRTNIDIEDASVALDSCFLDWILPENAYIIHRNVDLVSERFPGRGNDFVRRFNLPKVCLNDVRFAAIFQGFDVRGNLICLLLTFGRGIDEGDLPLR